MLRPPVGSLQRISAPKYWTVDQRLHQWAGQFKIKEHGFIYCPECGKTFLNDNNFLQTHMREKHVKDRLKNREQKLFRFHPGQKPRFSDSAFKIAKNQKALEKSWF